jgi:hypothetical protein
MRMDPVSDQILKRRGTEIVEKYDNVLLCALCDSAFSSLTVR